MVEDLEELVDLAPLASPAPERPGRRSSVMPSARRNGRSSGSRRSRWRSCAGRAASTLAAVDRRAALRRKVERPFLLTSSCVSASARAQRRVAERGRRRGIEQRRDRCQRLVAGAGFGSRRGSRASRRARARRAAQADPAHAHGAQVVARHGAILARTSDSNAPASNAAPTAATKGRARRLAGRDGGGGDAAAGGVHAGEEGRSAIVGELRGRGRQSPTLPTRSRSSCSESPTTPRSSSP